MTNLMLVQCVKNLDLSVLVKILSGVDSDHGTRSQKEWQCQLEVFMMSNRKNVMLTKDAP